MDYQPTILDKDVNQNINDSIQQSFDQEETKKKEQEQQVRLEQQAEEKAEKEDVSIGGEIATAFTGGLKDTASSVVTLPERAMDMFNGEMQEQGDNYVADSDPFKEDPSDVNKTWWGGVLRHVVHGVSLAAGVVLAAKGAAAVGIGGAAAKFLAGSGVSGLGANLARGAAIGGAQDLVSEYSQDANMLASIREMYPAIDTPLTTKDSDHPAIKTLKNVVEGMGIGLVADGIFEAIGRARMRGSAPVDAKPDRAAAIANAKTNAEKLELIKAAEIEDNIKAAVDKQLRQDTAFYLSKKGKDFKSLSEAEQIQEMIATQKRSRSDKYSTWSPPETAEQRAARKIEERNESVKDQTYEAAREELKTDDIGANKNKPLMDPHQAAHTSTEKPYDIAKQSRRITREYGADGGSTGSFLRPAERTRWAKNMPANVSLADNAVKGLYGDDRYAEFLRFAKKNKKDPNEIIGYAEEVAQQIIQGRNINDTPREFFDRLYKEINKYGDVETWQAKNVVAADLVNAALYTEIRDLAKAALEVDKYADIKDIGGPVAALRDLLIVGLTETKRARYMAGSELAAFGLDDATRNAVRDTPATQKKTLEAIHEETKNQVEMMLEVASKDPSDGLLKAMLEAFSMSGNINNWTDFDAFMRRRMWGETTQSGARKTGLIIREMQGMMINSVLSGPKTPIRAIMGTSTATFMRPMTQVLGAAMNFAGTGFTDSTNLRTALASLNAMRQSLPESTRYFMARLNGYMSGELSTIKSRYAEYSPADEQFELMKNWAETRGTDGDKTAFRFANIVRTLNSNKILTYSTKLMSATDDAFTMLLARSRAKEKAMMDAFDNVKKGEFSMDEITPEFIKEVEAREYAQIFDPIDGGVSDDILKFAKEEVTLTRDLTGFAAKMDQLFDTLPALKPFYLFARTGVNGLTFSMKHTPLLNRFVKENRDIMSAKPGDLDNVRQYGINTDRELANAKAIMEGRVAVGYAVTALAAHAVMDGRLTGNGPRDRQTKEAWKTAGWQARSIKVGNTWVSYDSMEPFSNVFAAIADFADAQREMGDEAVEQGLIGTSLAIAKGAVSKTYLQGLQQVFDLFGNDPKRVEKVIASMANNTLPLSSLRNEIGRLLNPEMRELSSSFEDQLRNRNLFMEGLAGKEDQLPIKYDILNGKPIRDWHFLTRAFNMVSPIQFNFDQSPGRQMLIRSNYNLRTSVYTAPEGNISLTDAPKVRSLFQKAIGEQGLEKKLDALAKRKDIQESIKQMELDMQKPATRRNDPMSYPHNIQIKVLMEAARRDAWYTISQDADVVALRKAAQADAASKFRRKRSDFEGANTFQQQVQEFQNQVNR